MWAPFYDIKTNKPNFPDRDGIAKANLADIGDERRNGRKSCWIRNIRPGKAKWAAKIDSNVRK
jgi:pectinesterase